VFQPQPRIKTRPKRHQSRYITSEKT